MRNTGWPSEVDNDQLRGPSKLILLQLHEKLLKNSTSTTVKFIQHLKQIGKVKKFDKWMPHELYKDKKNPSVLSIVFLILHNNNKPFLNQIVTCNEKWILYDNQH